MSTILNPSVMSLNRITPTMDINSQSFYPQSNRNSAAKTMQKLYRGNNTRKKMTQKKQAASKMINKTQIHLFKC